MRLPGGAVYRRPAGSGVAAKLCMFHVRIVVLFSGVDIRPVFGKEVPDLHVHAMAQDAEHAKGDIDPAGLDTAQVRAFDIAAVGELLHGQTTIRTALAQAQSDLRKRAT